MTGYQKSSELRTEDLFRHAGHSSSQIQQFIFQELPGEGEAAVLLMMTYKRFLFVGVEPF